MATISLLRSAKAVIQCRCEYGGYLRGQSLVVFVSKFYLLWLIPILPSILDMGWDLGHFY